MVDVQGRQLCRGCLSKLAAPAEPHSHTAGPSSMPGGRRISWGLLLIFSLFLPPGVNYMFMGLIKRGLAALVGFFFMIYIVGVSQWPLTMLFGMAIPIYVLTCIFDGFSIRRRINAGEFVPDNINEVITFLRRNKYVGWILLAIVSLSVLGSVVGIFIRLISWLMPSLIIVIGLYLLLRRRKPPSPPQE